MINNQQHNSLSAFKAIISHPFAAVSYISNSKNRANQTGDALEVFVKDAYSGLLGREITEEERMAQYGQVFSWGGNTSNPPDALIRGGDGIEVKKIESLTSDIALNSSFPKNKLHADDSRVATGAKLAENWTERDIVYAVGTVNSTEVKRLWLIYGDCLAATRETYERLFKVIGDGIRTIPDIEFHETNEIAKVKHVDPLAITGLRVRGMWTLQNPSRLYSELVNPTSSRQFYLLMREEKYQSFAEHQREELEQLQLDGYTNSVIEIRDPNNPDKLIQARLFKYEL